MGRTKAKFFARFGFDLANLNDFRDALVEHAQGANDWTTEFTAFGRKYVVERPLLTPDGRNPLLRSIWFEEHDESPVRLVTAYPVGGDR